MEVYNNQVRVTAHKHHQAELWPQGMSTQLQSK